MPQVRSDNHFIEIDGERKTLAEWVRDYEAFGVTRQLVLGRLERGWDEEEAVTTPPRKYRGKRTDK